jgi:hypothetical protein
LVIKDVNPLVCGWLLAEYRPRLIFIIRHPAAVALSYRQLGWWQGGWEEQGAYQAKALATAYAAFREYGDCRLVQYERLCREPEAGFADLFAFAGLAWDDAARNTIAARTGQEGSDAITRRSREMADRWKGRLTSGQLAALRAGYQSEELPWYEADEEWRQS